MGDAAIVVVSTFAKASPKHECLCIGHEKKDVTLILKVHIIYYRIGERSDSVDRPLPEEL